MRLRRAATATAVVPITLLCVWTAPPAAAASTHTISMSGTLTVSDAPSFGSSRTTRNFPITRLVRLSHDRPQDTLTASACAGGETTGELSVHVELRPDETVVATPTLRLFEGSSCLSRDLDGQDEGIQHGFRPGTSLTNWRLAAENGEVGSDDYTRVNFSLKHEAGAGIGIGRPAEPSNVIATRVAGDPTRVQLEWTDAATDETGYQIFNSSLQQTKGVAANATSFVWTGLPLGKQCFQVRAVNNVGPSDFTPVSAKSECV
ncbi:fibronectin type III domain-containing protein [Streptomyces sp. NPDC002054]|uniref:fibronectin type III domain-containing protein n=1 Tax=Streptomyces sp. NPDC002054 TaxID=3154663 RepID=UPI003318F908